MAASDPLGHPLAVWAFRELEGRPDVDKQLVYSALCRRLGVQSDDRLAAMRGALRACAGELGVAVPSAAQYEAWRVGSPTGVGAPTIAQLRRAGGSWSKALVLLFDAPEADPTRRRLLAHGGRFNQGAAVRAVREFLAWLPPDESPTLSRYLEWASRVPRDEDGRTRVPCNEQPFNRLFGSWSSALRAAGVEPSRMHIQRARRARRFTRDDLLVALGAAHAELGDPLSRVRYDAWVHERDRQADDEDARFQPAPLSATISNKLGGWRRACATVLGENVLLSRRLRPPDFSDEQLMMMYRECRQEIGRPPSGDEYDAWRLARTRTSLVDKTNALPHSNTLRRRLGVGAWSGVALAAGEELPRSRRRRAEFSTDELTAAYRACATAIGHDPSNGEFDAWREARLRDNPTDRVPASWTLVRRLGAGSWTSIAGAVNPGAVTGWRRALRYSAEELAAAWRACRDDLGRSPGQEAYDTWRHSRMRSDPHGRPLPFSRTLIKRLGDGTWRGVKQTLETGEVTEHDPI
jgi:hypothetical protein